jgi:dolichol kinase
VIHAATGLCALLLGVLPPVAAVACAIGGVLVGWVLFPLTGLDRLLRRPGEPFLGGLRTYPVAVLGLVFLLPPAEAAAAWAVLAFGDAAAAVAGRSVPAPQVPGSRKATLSGSLAHVVIGGGAAWGTATAVGGLASTFGVVDPGPLPTFAACFLAATAAAVVDAWLGLPDDNLPCAAAAGGVLRAARSLL